MINRFAFSLSAVFPLLAGCATTSFAPPAVSTSNVAVEQRNADGTSKTCAIQTSAAPITHDVTGAGQLIDNFENAYRCRMVQSANGRQAFEVPAFLAAAGAVTAAAFGAGPNVAIAAGSATAILGGAKNYYDPKAKSGLYNSALDAVLCIKTESAGVAAITVELVSQQKTGAEAAQPGPSVTIDPSEQYFRLVAASLISVERVLTDRLSNSGKYDAAGIVAEINANNAKIKEAQKDKPKVPVSPDAKPSVDDAATTTAATGGKEAGTISDSVAAPLDETSFKNEAERRRFEAQQSNAQTVLMLDVLQPKLNQCVVRAKL